MSTTYTFDLVDDNNDKTLRLKVNKNLLTPNDWEDADHGRGSDY
jgi:hypothetical protein